MMKLTQFPMVLIVGFAFLASSASAQRPGGGKDGGHDTGRAANNAPHKGGANNPDHAKDAVRGDAGGAKSNVRDNVDRPKTAAPNNNNSDRQRRNADNNPQSGGGNKAVQDPGRNAGRSTDKKVDDKVDNVQRDKPRQNNPRVDAGRPGVGTPPRIPDRTDVRVNPRGNIGGPNVAAAGPNAWRYRQHNNQWWYWTPNNSWVYWNNGAWIPYGALAGPRNFSGPYASGYRGTDSNVSGYLGVTFDPQVSGGAAIAQVNANSPAEEAGLQAGDVIRAVNGDNVPSANEASSMIRQYTPGTELSLRVERDRQATNVAVVLGQR